MLTYEFKAGKYIDCLYSVVLSDTLCHIHGDYGLYHNRILRHASVLLSKARNIVKEQYACLISA